MIYFIFLRNVLFFLLFFPHFILYHYLYLLFRPKEFETKKPDDRPSLEMLPGNDKGDSDDSDDDDGLEPLEANTNRPPVIYHDEDSSTDDGDGDGAS